MDKKVFIGGPISHLIGVKGFDVKFKEMHENIIGILKQLGYQILSAHLVEEYGENKIEPDEVIVSRDLAWIEDADLCIFLFPTKENEAIRTDGTFIELGYATAECERNIVFWNSKKADLYSPMFRGMIYKDIKFYDISEIREVLNSLE